MATSIMTTWIFNHSDGSVLLTAIFHAATDVTIAYANVMTGNIQLFWLFIVVQWIAAAAIILVEGSADFTRTGRTRNVIYPPQQP